MKSQVHLLRKTKKDFYNTVALMLKKLLIISSSGKQLNLSSLTNQLIMKKITLIENEEVISDEKKIANIFSTFYASVVENLGIDNESMKLSDADIPSLIDKFKNHTSILKTEQHYNSKNKFSCSPMNLA